MGMAAKRIALGQRGEALAAAYLEENGYVIIQNNWHCPHGEIDIIARKENIIAFVEVRSRHAENTEAAFASVKPAKQMRMRKSAYAYLAEHHLKNVEWRIDVIAVAFPRAEQPIIEHVENALDW